MTSSLSFEQRFAKVLRRRLYPNTGLRLKQMAHDLGYSEDTLQRWTRGDRRVYAGAAEDVDRYFVQYHHDGNFLREVLELRRLEPPVRDADLCFWVTEGALHHAPAGHLPFAGRDRRVTPLLVVSHEGGSTEDADEGRDQQCQQRRAHEDFARCALEKA